MYTFEFAALIIVCVVLYIIVRPFRSAKVEFVTRKVDENELITTSDPEITYSDYYTLPCCPKCHVIIKDERQARYYDRCCVKCGHSTGGLFDVSRVVVRNVYRNGKFIETVLKNS